MVLKLSTNRLPLFGTKFMISTTSMCPICHRKTETANHFLTCTRYRIISHTSLTQLQHSMNKKNIDPYLWILILRIIQNKPCDKSHLIRDHPTFPINDYQLLLHSQNNIGWLTVLKGYPSVQWYTHQQRYLQEMEISSRTHASTWIYAIYNKIYQILYDRWNYCNEKVHGKNNTFLHTQLYTRI